MIKQNENFEKMQNTEFIWHINSTNKPSQVELPPGEVLYEIDLNTRQIKGPECLGVKSDHDAELIYFTVDRFYDNVDLARTNAIIQFETIDKNTGKTYKGSYFIPIYDVITLKDEEKMILPWQVKNSVTQSATSIKYNFRFYMLAEKTNKIEYSLNTQITTSKILNTLDRTTLKKPEEEDDEEYQEICNEIDELRAIVSQSLIWKQTNWKILE